MLRIFFISIWFGIFLNVRQNIFSHFHSYHHISNFLFEFSLSFCLVCLVCLVCNLVFLKIVPSCRLPNSFIHTKYISQTNHSVWMRRQIQFYKCISLFWLGVEHRRVGTEFNGKYYGFSLNKLPFSPRRNRLKKMKTASLSFRITINWTLLNCENKCVFFIVCIHLSDFNLFFPIFFLHLIPFLLLFPVFLFKLGINL